MKKIQRRNRWFTGLCLFLSLSLFMAVPARAAAIYELFELEEGAASESGYIPVYDPAEAMDDNQPAYVVPSLAPRDAITSTDEEGENSFSDESGFSDGNEDPGTDSDQTQDLDDTEVFDSGQTGFDDEISVFSEPIQEEVPDEDTAYQASGLPSSFSLLDLGCTTPVKNQGSLGICWAFTALESIETGMIRRGLAAPSLSLSETHLAYTAFHGKNSLVTDGTAQETFAAPFDALWTKSGGNRLYTTATLARGYGPAYEADFPLSLAHTANASDSPGSDTSVLDSIITDDKKLTSVARLKNSYWLSEVNPASGPLAPQERQRRINIIKEFIMNYGAVEVGLHVNGHSWPYDRGTNSFYCSSYAKANHAVSLIGWDDTKVTAAPSPGAFFVQNSWGSSDGENGYFWLSYEDCSIKSPTFYEMENLPVGTTRDLIIHQYDGTGYGSVIQAANPDSLSDDFRMAGANVFTASKAQYLKQVSFYAGASALSYTISVYRFVKSSPDTGVLTHTQQGSFKYAGYYTIDLTKAIPIAANEKFAIVLQFDSKKGWIPHERASDNRKYTVAPGQSYLFNGEKWSDMERISFTDNETGEFTAYSCNLCIKGISEPTSDKISMAPSKPVLKSVVVNKGNRIKVTLQNTKEKNIDGYDYALGPVPGFLNQKNYEQVKKNQKSLSVVFTCVPKGTHYLSIHAYRLDANGRKVFSPWTDVAVVKITGTTPGIPKIKSVSTGKGTLKATYQKAASAYRYEYVLARKEFAADALSPTPRYKLYTNRKYGQVKLLGLPKGTYYFGVRAYTVSKGIKYRGKWAIKKVVIK